MHDREGEVSVGSVQSPHDGGNGKEKSCSLTEAEDEESVSVFIPITQREIETKRKKPTILRRTMTAKKSSGWSSTSWQPNSGRKPGRFVYRRMPKLSRTMDQRNYQRFKVETDHRRLVRIGIFDQRAKGHVAQEPQRKREKRREPPSNDRRTTNARTQR